jgi:hypothetical protein
VLGKCGLRRSLNPVRTHSARKETGGPETIALSIKAPCQQEHYLSVRQWLSDRHGRNAPRLGVGMSSGASRACPPKPVRLSGNSGGRFAVGATVELAQPCSSRFSNRHQQPESARLSRSVSACVSAMAPELPDTLTEARGNGTAWYPTISGRRTTRCASKIDWTNRMNQ